MISALRAAIEKIPTREERLGGQTFKYVKLSEVLDLLDTFRSNNADETQPAALNPKLQTRLREIAESLLCREGSGHYCPNCGNTTFDAAMSLKLLADQIGAPDETAGVQVAGDTLPTALWQFEQRANVLLSDEQAKVNPDNALIGFICDAVRLARENERLARSPLEPAREHLHWCAIRIGKDCNCWCDHPRSELLVRKGDAFEMRKCLECTKIFRVRL